MSHQRKLLAPELVHASGFSEGGEALVQAVGIRRLLLI